MNYLTAIAYTTSKTFTAITGVADCGFNCAEVTYAEALEMVHRDNYCLDHPDQWLVLGYDGCKVAMLTTEMPDGCQVETLIETDEAFVPRNVLKDMGVTDEEISEFDAAMFEEMFGISAQEQEEWAEEHVVINNGEGTLVMEALDMEAQSDFGKACDRLLPSGAEYQLLSYREELTHVRNSITEAINNPQDNVVSDLEHLVDRAKELETKLGFGKVNTVRLPTPREELASIRAEIVKVINQPLNNGVYDIERLVIRAKELEEQLELISNKWLDDSIGL